MTTAHNIDLPTVLAERLTTDPGMGFYKDEHGGPPSGYGFSGYTATGL